MALFVSSIISSTHMNIGMGASVHSALLHELVDHVSTTEKNGDTDQHRNEKRRRQGEVQRGVRAKQVARLATAGAFRLSSCQGGLHNNDRAELNRDQRDQRELETALVAIAIIVALAVAVYFLVTDAQRLLSHSLLQPLTAKAPPTINRLSSPWCKQILCCRYQARGRPYRFSGARPRTGRRR